MTYQLLTFPYFFGIFTKQLEKLPNFVTSVSLHGRNFVPLDGYL